MIFNVHSWKCLALYCRALPCSPLLAMTSNAHHCTAVPCHAGYAEHCDSEHYGAMLAMISNAHQCTAVLFLAGDAVPCLDLHYITNQFPEHEAKLLTYLLKGN